MERAKRLVEAQLVKAQCAPHHKAEPNVYISSKRALYLMGKTVSVMYVGMSDEEMPCMTCHVSHEM